ncbi:MAG: gamma-glutamyl-gamma-aminobutyrate hydrolase family protein [Lachnotalea sp.]
MNDSVLKVLIGGYKHKVDNYVSALKYVDIISIVAFEDAISTNNTFLETIDISMYDGLLLPGGGDIDPDFFHEENRGSKQIDLVLDMMQFKLLELFIMAGKPVLGICKGLQIINVFFGGTIIQDLPTANLHAWDKEDKVHFSIAVPHTFICDLYGETLKINSAHHQGAGHLGDHLLLSQLSCDNVVEAIYHEFLPIIAVQWHPERMCFDNERNDTVNGEDVFQYFKNML